MIWLIMILEITLPKNFISVIAIGAPSTGCVEIKHTALFEEVTAC